MRVLCFNSTTGKGFALNFVLVEDITWGWVCNMGLQHESPDPLEWVTEWGGLV